ncbi:MAG: hypothetical protein R3Y32_01000 [Bacillota bacterium]
MNGIETIRALAEEYSNVCASDRNKDLRKIWTNHNSYKDNRPLILLGMDLYNVNYPLSDLEIVANGLIDDKLVNTDPFMQNIERALRWKLYHASIKDDTVFEPYMMVPSVRTPDGENRWGVPCGMGEHVAGGAGAYNPVIFEEDDLDKIIIQDHKIDIEATKALTDRYNDVLGGKLTAISDDRPTLFHWSGDIITDMAKLVGLENLFYLLVDEPDMLHKLAGMMRDAILKSHNAWEANGEANSTSSFNQAMPYAEGIASMESKISCGRKDMFMFYAAQEMTSVSPDMWKEFCLDYQKPLMEKFGLIAYGCCEDLTRKLDYLFEIPNMRRISVSPFANVEKCAEKIGDKYIISYRPNPSSMVSRGINEDTIRKEIGEAKTHFNRNNCIFDLDLKDVQTVNGDSTVLPRFIEIARSVLEK